MKMARRKMDVFARAWLKIAGEGAKTNCAIRWLARKCMKILRLQAQEIF
jgi:uncharacterized protein YfaT (DUF1175 family)